MFLSADTGLGKDMHLVCAGTFRGGAVRKDVELVVRLYAVLPNQPDYILSQGLTVTKETSSIWWLFELPEQFTAVSVCGPLKVIPGGLSL